jgi:hypothetical protein
MMAEDPDPQTLCSILKYGIMEMIQNVSNTTCNTPSSEPFRIGTVQVNKPGNMKLPWTSSYSGNKRELFSHKAKHSCERTIIQHS